MNNQKTKPIYRIMSILLVLLLACMISMPSSAMLKPNDNTKIKIACIGASTTVGFGATTSYPSALQTLLGDRYEVMNYGVNATTVQKDGVDGGTPMAYMDTDNYTQSKNYQPDIVIIMIGANDSKPENWKDGENNFAEDYDELVSSYCNLASEPTVLIATDVWVQKTQWGINDATVSGYIAPIEKALAEKKGLPFIDLHAVTEGQDSYYIDDGVHMNDTGYAAIAAELSKKITTELTAQPRVPGKDGETVKIACVGASTTEGTDGHSYPAYLQAMLGGGCEVRNFGYGGSAVLQGYEYSYIGSQKYNDSLAYQADVVIIDIGGNDSQPQYWQDGNNTFAVDYDALVTAYLNQGNNPVVLISNGLLALKDSWGISDDVIKNDIMPLQKAIAKKHNLPIVNFRAVLESNPDGYIVEDGIHYTAAGYKAMAQLYYDALTDGLIELSGENQNRLWNPSTVNPSILITEENGSSVIKWTNGQTGYFSYDSGSLALALGLDEGTVVDNLTIKLSYLWEHTAGDNDWMHFNTTDKDGLSAPSADGTNLHDNGYGKFTDYGMVKNQWSELVVSRDDQLLGGGGVDWSMSIGDLNAANSLTVNGITVTATVGNVQKTVYWGIYPIEESQPFDVQVSATGCVQSNPQDGDSITFTATLRNIGDNATTGDITVDFYLDGKLVETQTVTESITNQKPLVVITSTAKNINFGSHSVKVIVSAENSDTDSSNNIKKSRFLVQ